MNYEKEYLDRISERLYSSVLADILDDLGYRQQVMDHEVRPLYNGARVVGRAATMLAVEVSKLPDNPYDNLMELLDGIVPGEVVVGTVQSRANAAIWGELLSTHTRAKGGRGVVVDGLSRDLWGIAEMKFPVFARGLCPADSKGRLEVIAIRGTIPVAGVSVANGDLVLADEDGVVVVPSAVEDEVVRLAFEKVEGEDEIRDILRKGANLRAVFKEHGIL
ncbi:MAG TPA: RraA family protein [Candidatus Dormibacteraeota bacterium]|nr:RraA family protein [Candidatus Dormibacteraeota bacterium]